MFSNLRKYIPNFLSKYYFVGGSRASWAVQMCLPKLTKFEHFPCFTTKFNKILTLPTLYNVQLRNNCTYCGGAIEDNYPPAGGY